MPQIPYDPSVTPLKGLPGIWDGTAEEDSISEKLAGISPNGASFSSDGNSRASMVYIIDGYGTALNSAGSLTTFCQQALGLVVINDEDGSLKRFAPMAHPQYRWLYADKISSIKGIGPLRNDEADPSAGVANFPTDADNSYQVIPPYFVVYKKYEVTVEFGPRPYLPISDDTMNKLETEEPGNYKIIGPDNVHYQDDGTEVTIEGSPFREYKRFTTFFTETSAEYMTLKGGAFEFRSDVDGNPEGSLKINGLAIPGFYGKTLLPKTTLKMLWYDVPYAFVDPTEDASTNIHQALGRVNQNWFWGFAPGELLFVGFSNSQKMKNQFDQWNYDLNTPDNLPKLKDILLTDITFNFLYIPVISYDKNGAIYPANPAGTFNPDNLSYINAGHNLAMCAANKKYYPVVSKDPTGDKEPPDEYKQRPPYLSYPFELMFNALPYKMGEEPTE